MKKVITILIAFALLVGAIAIAEDIDLTNMTREELLDLHERVNEELKINHKLSSSEETRLQYAAKKFVEAVFEQSNMKVSWAWFDYEYVRDWGYATMSTHMDATDENKKSQRYNVVVGAYLQGEEWEVIYLSLNDEDVYDMRDQIPDPRLNPNAGASEPIAEPTQTPTPIPVVVPTNTPTPEPTPEPTTDPNLDPSINPANFLISQGVPEGIASDREYTALKRGDKGEAVKALQNDLIEAYYLDGKADGDYGAATEAAVKQCQAENGLEETGVADPGTQAFLRLDVYMLGGYDEQIKALDKASADAEEPEEANQAAAQEMPASLDSGRLLSITETGENDIVVVKAKIEPSYSNKATVDQNYYNIEYLVKKFGFARYNTVDYWAVADMNDGSEQKVVAFTVPKDVLQLLADGKIPANRLGEYVNDLWIHPSLN